MDQIKLFEILSFYIDTSSNVTLAHDDQYLFNAHKLSIVYYKEFGNVYKMLLLHMMIIIFLMLTNKLTIMCVRNHFYFFFKCYSCAQHTKITT